MTPPNAPSMDELRRDLASLGASEVVVFGSAATGDMHARSDVDVAVVTRDADRARNEALWGELLGRAPDAYEVRIYELLPLPVQVAIADDHVVVFGDELDLSEYFYEARKRWRDVGPRMRANRFETVAERLRALGLR